MLTFAVLVTLIHVNNAETCQEMESKSTVAASFVQTRRIEGKMIANEKEEAFLGADPQWFPNKHGDAQIEATNTTFYIEKCNAGTDPKKKMLEDARISHATCRSEQQTINGSNVSQNCYGEKKAACDSMQSIFEESYCTYAESKEDYCKEFEACHAAANSAHASAKQKVEQQEQDLREMYIQHRRLECKIAAWPLTTSSKSACESQSFDTSQLDVTYPTKPTQVPCNHPVFPVPGEKDWAATEYSAKSWKALVQPVRSCTPAPTPAPVPVWVMCARLRDTPGTTADGNTYLSSSWGARDLTDWASTGNHCPDIANPTAIKFKVWTQRDKLSFETLPLNLTENVFVKTSGYYGTWLKSGDPGWIDSGNPDGDAITIYSTTFKMDQVSDQTGTEFWGRGCMEHNRHGQQLYRTTLCASSSNGAGYLLVVGGLDDDYETPAKLPKIGGIALKGGGYLHCKTTTRLDQKCFVEIYMEH